MRLDEESRLGQALWIGRIGYEVARGVGSLSVAAVKQPLHAAEKIARCLGKQTEIDTTYRPDPAAAESLKKNILKKD